MRKESFVMYSDWYESIKNLSDEQLGQLLRAVFEYEINGVESTAPIDTAVSMAFSFILSRLRKDADIYEARCAKNRENIQKRWDDKRAYDRIRPHTTEYAPIPNDNDNDNIVIPAELNEERFVKVWQELIKLPKWRQKKATCLRMNLSKLSAYGAERAVELVEKTIAGNYQGIPYPKDYHKPSEEPQRARKGTTIKSAADYDLFDE